MRRVRFALHLLAIAALAAGVCVGAFARAIAGDSDRARALRDRLAAEPACDVYRSAAGMPAGAAGFVAVGSADPATVAAVLALLPDTARAAPNRGRVNTPDSFRLLFGPAGQTAHTSDVLVGIGPDWLVVTVDG